jgi:DNA-binding Lrp family transcriptional regulator
MNGEVRLDRVDLMLLDALQDTIPLVSRPWSALGTRLGIPAQEVLERLGRMRDLGIVRAVSPILDSHHLGLTATTLLALPVPVERISDVAAIISGYPEVSHNFQRENTYSVWFTLTAESEERLGELLSEILERIGIPERDILNLSTVRKFKIDVRFSHVLNGRLEEGHGST